MLNTKKNAFTMIELIFVIVVLGILASVAIPKMAATRTDAHVAKGRSDIAAIRSAIVSERQTRLIRGKSEWITQLSQGATTLFDGNGSSELLMYGITPGTEDGKWNNRDNTYLKYVFYIGGVQVNFDYDNTSGKFDCNTSAGTATQQKYCKSLTQ